MNYLARLFKRNKIPVPSASSLLRPSADVTREHIPRQTVVIRRIADIRDEYEIDQGELGTGRWGVVRRARKRENSTTASQIVPRMPPERTTLPPAMASLEPGAILNLQRKLRNAPPVTSMAPPRPLAIKSIAKTGTTQSEFFNEVSCLAEAQGCDNIEQLVDAVEDGTHFHLVSPFYSGGELFDRIVNKEIFSEGDASFIAAEMLRAKAHLVRKCIVHRDIKPENFLFTTPHEESARLILIDFGMAKYWRPRDPLNYPPMRLRCGSPSYVAPEVREEGEYKGIKRH